MIVPAPDQLVLFKKADLPGELARLAKELSGLIVGSSWVEIAAWGTCKLVARKRGAITQYARKHRGYYACCRLEQVRQAGLATFGMSVDDLPGWARLQWNQIWAAHTAPSSGQPELTFVQFTRLCVNTIDVVFRDRNGQLWSAPIQKDRWKRVPAVMWSVLWSPVEHGSDAASALEELLREELAGDSA